MGARVPTLGSNPQATDQALNDATVQNRVASEQARDVAAAHSQAAEQRASEAAASADGAGQARDAAHDVLQATGPVADVYGDRATLDGLLPGLADGLYDVAADETRAGRQSRYRLDDGALVWLRYTDAGPVRHPTLAAALAATGYEAGDTVLTSGRDAEGDGGAGTYRVAQAGGAGDPEAAVPESVGVTRHPVGGGLVFIPEPEREIVAARAGLLPTSPGGEQHAAMKRIADLATARGGRVKVVLEDEKVYDLDADYAGGANHIRVEATTAFKIEGNGSTFRTRAGVHRAVSADGTVSPLMLVADEGTEIYHLRLEGRVDTMTRDLATNASGDAVVGEGDCYGFQALSSINGYAEGLVASGFATDGFRFRDAGGAYRDAEGRRIASKGWTMVNSVSQYNGRQGMTPGQAHDCEWRRCLFRYSGWTGLEPGLINPLYGSHSPASGVDIEPGRTARSVYRPWQPHTYYAEGDVVVASSAVYPYSLRVLRAGMSGAQEPAWPTLGGTVTEGPDTVPLKWTTGLSVEMDVVTGELRFYDCESYDNYAAALLVSYGDAVKGVLWKRGVLDCGPHGGGLHPETGTPFGGSDGVILGADGVRVEDAKVRLGHKAIYLSGTVPELSDVALLDCEIEGEGENLIVEYPGINALIEENTFTVTRTTPYADDGARPINLAHPEARFRDNTIYIPQGVHPRLADPAAAAAWAAVVVADPYAIDNTYETDGDRAGLLDPYLYVWHNTPAKARSAEYPVPALGAYPGIAPSTAHLGGPWRSGEPVDAAALGVGGRRITMVTAAPAHAARSKGDLCVLDKPVVGSPCLWAATSTSAGAGSWTVLAVAGQTRAAAPAVAVPADGAAAAAADVAALGAVVEQLRDHVAGLNAALKASHYLAP